MTSIQGFSQALLDGTAGDEPARRRAATVISEEADRMRRLVDDLLDLARLEARQVEFAREAVHIEVLLRESMDRFAPMSEASGTRLDLEADSSLPLVIGDAKRLGQVFDNLVDNALKHARAADDGGVMLRAEKGKNYVLC